MMGPILYNSKERDFKSLGIGILADEIETLITEERNGQFFLEMQYPTDGRLFNEIKVGRLIKANASTTLRGQQFKVIRITKHAKGTARVYAEHVSNQTAELQLKPDVEYKGTAAQALSIWEDSIVTRHDFETHSDVTTKASGEWGLLEVDNARQALGGVEGSILDRYKGEFLFDNYQIYLKKNRGVDRGLIVAYGKNLIDLEQEEEIASTYTSVMPYSTYTPERVQGTGEVLEPITLTLPEYFIDSEHADKFARRKIKKVDFSEEKINDVGELRLRAQQYIRANNIGVPQVNLKVQLLDLAKTEDYKDTAHSEDIGLCDWVTVYFEDLDINQKVKVVKTVFNHTADRYKEIELGESRSNLTHAIDISLDSRFDDIYKGLNTVQASADGKNKVFRGVDEPEYGMVAGDVWYKPVNDSEHLMYIYDGNSWGEPVVDVLTNRTIDKAIEEAKKDIADAEERANEIRDRADAILEGLGVDPIEVEHDNIIAGIQGKVNDRLDRFDSQVGGLSSDITEFAGQVDGRLGELSNEIAAIPGEEFINTTISHVVDEELGEVRTSIAGIIEKPTETIFGYNIMKSSVEGNVSEIARISTGLKTNTANYNTLKETAEGIEREIGEIISSPEEKIIGYNTMKSTAEGNFTEIAKVKQSPGTTISGYQKIEERSDLYSRTIGASEAGIKNNVARIVMSDSLFQTEISNPLSGFNTRFIQLEDSFSFSIKEGEDIVSEINATPEEIRLASKKIVLDADTVINGALTTTGDIITGGNIRGVDIRTKSGNVGGWDLDDGGLYKRTPFGYTTLKPGGDVAIGIASPQHGHTTGAALQIWHNGRIRFGNTISAIDRDPNNNSLNLTGSRDINLMPAVDVTVRGSLRPRTMTDSDTLGTDRYRWRKILATSDSWDTGSDIRYKRDITNMSDSFYRFFSKEVQPKSFTENNKSQFGYLAQDVQRALFKYGASLPENTTLQEINEYVDSFGLLNKGESYMSLVYPQVAVIKERALQQQVTELEERILKLEELLDG